MAVTKRTMATTQLFFLGIFEALGRDISALALWPRGKHQIGSGLQKTIRRKTMMATTALIYERKQGEKIAVAC